MCGGEDSDTHDGTTTQLVGCYWTLGCRLGTESRQEEVQLVQPSLYRSATGGVAEKYPQIPGCGPCGVISLHGVSESKRGLKAGGGSSSWTSSLGTSADRYLHGVMSSPLFCVQQRWFLSPLRSTSHAGNRSRSRQLELASLPATRHRHRQPGDCLSHTLTAAYFQHTT